MPTLTALAVKNAQPRERPYKLSDGGGLYLLVTPAGRKYWRVKYRFRGKETVAAVGVYPAVSVAVARAERERIKTELAAGINPNQVKRIARAAGIEASTHSFKAVALEWLEEVHRHAVVPDHYERNKRRLELDAFPSLGHRPVGEIDPPELLACLKKIQKRGHLETANRVKSLCGQVVRYAITTGRATTDPTPSLKGALKTAKVKHHAAITDPDEVPGLLRAMYGYGGTVVTIAALKISSMVFVRPGELRQALWADVDLKAAQWAFQPSKNGDPLIVPLPSQAVAVLKELHELTGRGKYVFVGARSNDRPMSNATIKAALDRMGFKGEMTAHGFRAMARTILAERLNYPPEYIEQQLAHSVRDANGRAYNRTAHLEQRREMLQTWANYLDALREGSTNIVPIKRNA